MLTTEEAALRHVAMLVARGGPTPDIFDAVAEQVARVLGRPWVGVMRFDSAESFVVVTTWGDHPFPIGSRWPLDGPSVYEAVLRTGLPAAVDYAGQPGTVAQAASAAGIVEAIAAPIVVDGTTWGVIAVPATAEAPIPPGAETRLAVFTELVGTAISNADARASLALLVDEQAALRRVATLVARESSPVEIFVAVTDEACRVVGAEAVGLLRFDPDETATLLAQSETPWDPPPLGTRFPLDGENIVTRVFRSGQTVRVDDWTGSTGAVSAMANVLGVRSAVACPLVVNGRQWGTVIASTSRDEPLPATTESRLVQFTGLVATAIANAQARGQLSRLVDEQAALRRIAVLVAEQPSPDEVFTAVTEAVGPLLGADLAAMHLFGGDGVATVVASWTQAGPTLPIGVELPLDGDSAVARIFRTRAAARIDTYTDVEGDTAEVARGLHLRSTVGAPILVEGKLWGALMAATRGEEPLPDDAEARIAAFTELVATAVSNAQARGELHGLADAQAALRRVATLVARGIAAQEVFRAVAVEVGVLFGAEVAAIMRFEDDGTVTVLGDVGVPDDLGTRVALDDGLVSYTVRETGRSARFDTDDPSASDLPALVHAVGIRSSVASPIVVDGTLWGAMMAASVDGPLPSSAERRLTEFTELVATAVANTQARERVTALADEQAALRRVATLVAEDAPPAELFRAVAVELGRLLGADFSGLARFIEGAVVPIAVWSAENEHPPLPERWPLQPGDPATMIAEGQRSVRVDDWSEMPGPIAAYVRDELGVRSTVVTAIVVEGRMWGCVAAHSRQPLPPQSESRLSQFSDLVATAVGNAEARGEVARLASEQAALRRIATLVAEGAEAERVFAAVTEETATTFDAITAITRFGHDPPENVIVGVSAETGIPLGTRWPLADGMTSTEVYRTGRSARLRTPDWPAHPGPVAEAGLRFGVTSQVASPIVVDGRLWGVITLNAAEELPADTEQRLEKFTELVTTAIANAEAGIALRTAADEQRALRRVATLVAASAAPSDVFAAVTHEIALVLGADACMLCRVDDGGAVVVGTWADGTPEPEHGTRIAQGGTNLITIVLDTGRSARIENYAGATGDAGAFGRAYGLSSAVGAPIHVEGRLWGLVVAGTTRAEPLPPDAEERLAGFTELVATAISNATARDELIASRARIVEAGDEARRRIERNLHDGTQQRLIALGLDLQRVRATIPADQAGTHAAFVEVEGDLETILEDLRELSHGLHPPLLARAGLRPSLRALARRSPIPVELEIDLPARPSPSVEIAVYYVVSEALTNAIKHSRASSISVTVTADHGEGVFALDLLGHRAAAHVYVTIADDGVGGAQAGAGSGLTGLADRVNALGGRLDVDSPVGQGTRISVDLPVELPALG